MGTSRSFWASRVVTENRGAIRCLAHPGVCKRQRTSDLAAALFGFLAVVGAVQVLSTRAEARNTPPKNERQDPPAPPVVPADTPKGQTQTPPPVAPGDTPKGETQTPPPVAPPDAPKGDTPPLDPPPGATVAPSDLQKNAATGSDGGRRKRGSRTRSLEPAVSIHRAIQHGGPRSQFARNSDSVPGGDLR